jgi:dihydrofolate reductase
MLSAIFATLSDGTIGAKTDEGKHYIPWPRIKPDMQHFAKVTKSRRTMIMGRATWDQMCPDGVPLPGRHHAVVQRDLSLLAPKPQKVVFYSPLAAVEWATNRRDSPVVIGGASLLAQLWPLVTELFLTRVELPLDYGRGVEDTRIRFRYEPEAFRLDHEIDRGEVNGTKYRIDRFKRIRQDMVQARREEGSAFPYDRL